MAQRYDRVVAGCRFAAVISLTLLLCLLLVPIRSIASGQHEDLQSSVRREYLNRRFILRGFYTGAKLDFDSTGTLVGNAERGFWASDGLVLVESISLKHGHLLIKGHRLISLFDPAVGSFEDSLTDQKYEIDIRGDSSWRDGMESFNEVMTKVFTSSQEYIRSEAPAYWGCWLLGQIVRVQDREWKCSGEGKAPLTDTSRTAYLGGVNPPATLDAPYPRYTQIARSSRVEGTSVLTLTVGEDGKPFDIRIAKPLGGGLDDEAVEAVRRWTFSPGTKDGQPVPVRINVEVNFRLSNGAPGDQT